MRRGGKHYEASFKENIIAEHDNTLLICEKCEEQSIKRWQ